MTPEERKFSSQFWYKQGVLAAIQTIRNAEATTTLGDAAEMLDRTMVRFAETYRRWTEDTSDSVKTG